MARYHGPVRFNVVGDRRLAAPYYGVARRFLGDLASRLAEAGISSGTQERRFNDGTIIRVQVAGDVYAIEITVSPFGRTQPQPVIRGIVCTPNNTTIDVIDDDNPQIVLSPPSDEYKTQSWRTYFYSTSIVPYFEDSVQGATYGQTFTDGLLRGGNIDWVGNDKIHLSFYGPHSRYWFHSIAYEDTATPLFFYDVYCDGKVLINLAAYAIAEDDPNFHGLVCGAGLRKVNGSYKLYVIAREEVAIANEDPVDVKLLRFNIEADGDGYSNGAVVSGSGVVLHSWTSACVYSPFFMNASCTRAVHVSTEGATLLADCPEPSLLPGMTPPAASNRLITVRFDDEDNTTPTVDEDEINAYGIFNPLNSIGGGYDMSGVVAADYRGDTLVFATVNISLVFQDVGGQLVGVTDRYLSIGNDRLHITRYYLPDQDPYDHIYPQFNRLVVSADLRANAVLLFRETGIGVANTAIDYELARRGEIVDLKSVPVGAFSQDYLAQMYLGPDACCTDYPTTWNCSPTPSQSFSTTYFMNANVRIPPGGYDDPAVLPYLGTGALYVNRYTSSDPGFNSDDWFVDQYGFKHIATLQTIDDTVFASVSRRSLTNPDGFTAYAHITGGNFLPMTGVSQQNTRALAAWVQDKPLKVGA